MSLSDYVKREDLAKFFTETVNHGRELWRYHGSFDMSGEEIDDLDGKDILLVGGGASRVLTELEHALIKPATVTNLDPFAVPQPDNPRQKLISEKFCDHKIEKDSYDEIWSLFALPLYAENPQEYMNFWGKSVTALRPNGKLRVFPLNVHARRGSIFVAPEMTNVSCYELFKKFAGGLTENTDAKLYVSPPNRTRDDYAVNIHMPADKTAVNDFASQYI